MLKIFLPMLAIALIVLKLLGLIFWSWLWVLASLWGPVAIIVVITLVIFVFHLLILLVEFLKEKYREGND